MTGCLQREDNSCYDVCIVSFNHLLIYWVFTDLLFLTHLEWDSSNCPPQCVTRAWDFSLIFRIFFPLGKQNWSIRSVSEKAIPSHERGDTDPIYNFACLIAPLLCMSSLSKNCPNLNIHCPVCYSLIGLQTVCNICLPEYIYGYMSQTPSAVEKYDHHQWALGLSCWRIILLQLLP